MHALSAPPPLAAPRRAALRRSSTRRHFAARAVAAPPEQLQQPGDVLQYVRPASLPRVRAPRDAPPILVLPGFGNESGDYLAPFGVEEASLAAALRSRGYAVHVLPLERKDWFKVAGGLLSPNFYAGQCTADEGYGWCVTRRLRGMRRCCCGPRARGGGFVCRTRDAASRARMTCFPAVGAGTCAAWRRSSSACASAPARSA